MGMGRAGDALARMALEVAPSFTIGVIGKWGFGKTSVLRRAFATEKETSRAFLQATAE
jgi:hypothetical protein